MGDHRTSRFFPREDLMRVGVYYYPEAWPESQWARDVANIKSLGFEFVHMGEFAWSRMEPAEGRFELDWLERVVSLCAEQGLKVVLCTPSATPPVWLTSRCPDVLMVDADGRRMMHGTREHACWSSATYRGYVGRINDELGRRFGHHPAVWGWQIDNELSHYGKGMCFCDACQQKFRAWLGHKYETVANLNRDWGASFWSQTYDDFAQVRLPNAKELVAQVNPHAVLDANRWFADEAADYIRFQAGTLRAHCGERQWVTTNFMHAYPGVDPQRSAGDLDIATWTIYPAHGNLNQGPLGFRLGDMAEISFASDAMRGVNGAHGVMELQPGQVNWGEVNPQPLPGAIFTWIMRAFAADAKLVCTYRYRQPLSGSEQYHHGVVGPDGVTPTVGGEQFARAATTMVELRKRRVNASVGVAPPAEYGKRRAAILYNIENRWEIDGHKQTIRWDTRQHLFRYYRALKRLGCPVDVIPEHAEFSEFPVLLAPAYQLLDEPLVNRWTRYVEDGGHLVLSCRTGHKDRRGFLWEASWAAPIRALIGADVEFYDVLPAPHVGRVEHGGTSHEWVTWADVLKPHGGTTVLATYADQFYAGRAAAVTRPLGRGSVTYLGVDSRDGQLEADVMRGVFDRAGIGVASYDDGFVVDWRDGFWVAANFTERTQVVPAAPGVQLIVGTRELPPAGVAVWQDV